ncbi:MAG: hypothetical protein ACYDHH_09675 [Solirubrobacteraceae bacterium]
MELISAKGTDWTHAAWIDGDLGALLETGQRGQELTVARAELSAAQAELSAAQAELRAARAELTELAQVEEEINEFRSEAGQAAARAATLEYALKEQTAVINFLQRRHETLTRIEEGGWWQLRQRLLPVLRLLGALRRLRQTGR